MKKNKITNEDNKKLFLYGLLSKCKVMGGWFIILLSIGVSASFQSIIPFIVGLFAGGYLIYLGKAERFDYKKQSGTIIHKGDMK